MSIKRIIIKVIECIFYKSDFSCLCYTKVGVKSLNQLMKNQEYYIINQKNIEAGELFLGLDGLKDHYTLMDCCLLDSPHYKLMKAIRSENPIKETEYCKRTVQGTLDSRRAIELSDRYLKMMLDKYVARNQEIQLGTYKPVQVYQLENRYYIADGKHRAALCAVLNKEIKCDVISSDYLKDSFRLWMIKKMLKMYKKNGEYSKHSLLFKLLK